MLYRLCSLYYSPEYTHYFLQERETKDLPWRTIPSVSTQTFTEEETIEFRKAWGVT